VIHSDLLIAFWMRRGTLLHSPGPRALAEFLIESSAECDRLRYSRCLASTLRC
jgi:hypothetical protein